MLAFRKEQLSPSFFVHLICSLPHNGEDRQIIESGLGHQLSDGDFEGHQMQERSSLHDRVGTDVDFLPSWPCSERCSHLYVCNGSYLTDFVVFFRNSVLQ